MTIDLKKSNPTILLGMPRHYNLYQSIIKNLQHHNFQVIDVVQADNFKYPSVWSRIQTKLQKVVLRDTTAKQRLKDKVFDTNLRQLLPLMQDLDYALFIRGDIYPAWFLEATQEYSKSGSVNYQWDGLNRFPDIWQVKSCFDRFYVFDSNDFETTENVLPAMNFYFDYPLKPTDEQSDFYFTGADLPERRQVIADFGRLAKKQGWKLNFTLLLTDSASRHEAPKIFPDNIHLTLKFSSFEDNLRQAKASKVLVDFVNSHHTGLSFRVFEALGYHKKLITTNPTVADYDFYHPNNIFIWDGKSLDGIETFFKLPYIQLDKELYEKYSFGNWIRYILDIHPHQKITLPVSKNAV